MRPLYLFIYIAGLAFSSLLLTNCNSPCPVSTPGLEKDSFKHYVDKFNSSDEELYAQYITNDSAWSFLKKNIPFVDLPDKQLEETYYFRWWTFRKHIKKSNNSFVISEFLPEVNWAGKYNTISCAAGHHFSEGRWLQNPEYLKDYMKFWLNDSDDGIRSYSFWAAYSLMELYKVHPDMDLLGNSYPLLISNYKKWEEKRLLKSSYTFWQIDDRDGMEMSVGSQILSEGGIAGHAEAIRPTINSYMYADAISLSEIGKLLDLPDDYHIAEKARLLKMNTQKFLWDKDLGFFGVRTEKTDGLSDFAGVRELIGYVPWYFNLPDDKPKYAIAWKQILDTSGFAAPKGLTVCERRHPYFKISYEGHECQWNGPSWPFATTQTLVALSNFINNYQNRGDIDKQVFYDLLLQYSQAHYINFEDGTVKNWIDENMNPFTGDWISRTRLKNWNDSTWSENKGGVERGKDYNHSAYCDIIISHLIGIKPQIDNKLVIKPLIPDGWNWFMLDNLKYHDRAITIMWDKSGERYNQGKGFSIFVDGDLKYHSIELGELTLNLQTL